MTSMASRAPRASTTERAWQLEVPRTRPRHMARLRSTSGGSSDDYHSGSEGPLGEMSSAPRDDIDGLLNTPGAFSTSDSHPDSRGPPSSMMSVDVHDDEEHGELEDLSSFKPSPLSVSRGHCGLGVSAPKPVRFAPYVRHIATRLRLRTASRRSSLSR